MASKRFTYLVVLRVLLLFASMAVASWLWLLYDLKFTYIFLFILVLTQVVELIRFVNRTNTELGKFLDALRYGDYSVGFSNTKLGGSFSDLNESFTEVIEMLKTSRAEKESHAELLSMALENIRLGLIIWGTGNKIVLMNSAAREMLMLPKFKTWEMLQKKKSSFTQHLGDFSFEGRKLIEIETDSESREFYLDLSHISLLGQTYHLIAFSDLKNEIEQKEIDAWHKLIRILAHEVMNSVTPVTSLSETIRGMLTDSDGNTIDPQNLTAERMEDIVLALDTIVRRSKGMLNFVEDYRKLTKLPAPKLETVPIEQLFEEVCQLMKPQAHEKGINLKTELNNKRLAVRADRKMIEQTLINLVGNAIYAMEEQGEGEIVLSASMQESHLLIQVKDNGPGIPEDILPSIFIPFFSTRKNGTGIGLSLSKSIMRLHTGNISVRSKPGEETTFDLMFNI